MVSFTATGVELEDDEGLLAVLFSARRKYVHLVRDTGPMPVNRAFYIEVNDQGGGGYGWASRVELHRDRLVIVASVPVRIPLLDRVEVQFQLDDDRFQEVLERLTQIFAEAPGVLVVLPDAQA